MKIKHMAKSALMGMVALSVVGTGVGISQPSFATSVKETSVQTAKLSTQSSTNLNMMLPIKAKDYRISSHFGNRCAPVLGASFFHGATDLAAKDGTPIYASLDGKVTGITQASGSQVAGLVVVDYGTVNGKNLTVSYNHMWDATKYVKLGQTVKKGQIIAEVGSSGASTGPHLHMSTSYGGVAVDAIPLFSSFGLDLKAGATSVAAVSNPTICKGLYASADMGLKKSANGLSETIAVLKRNTPLEITPGPSVNGYIKAKEMTTGKTGYLVSNVIDKKITTAPEVKNVSKSTANVRYTVKSNQNIRSYPSTLKGESGILDTVVKGRILTTTGRVSGTYTEVNFNLGTGWISTSMLLSAPDPAKITGTKSVAKNVLYTPNLSTNLFSYPDLSSSVYKDSVINLKKGAEVRTTGRALGTNWTEITYSGKKYWAVNTYIHRTTPALPKTSTMTKSISYKSKATTGLRNYPSSDNTISWALTNIPKNAVIKNTGKTYSSWIEVSYAGKIGWVTTSQITRQVAALPKLTTTTKNVPYAVKSSSTQIRNYPSTSEVQGWNLKTISKSTKVTNTGRKYGSYIEVKNGSTTGWTTTSNLSRVVASLPKTSSTTKNVSYKTKATTQMRNYPSTSETQGWNIKTLAKNSIVKTTGRKYGSWIEVSSGSTKGWVLNTQATRQVAKLPKVSNTSKSVYYKVKVSSAQIRNYPSTSEVQGWNLKTIKKNTKMTTTGKKYGSYIQVKSGTTTGWIKTSQVSRTTANLPKLSNTTKNVTYKAKSTQKIMNYPSTSTAKGWDLKTIKKNTKVKTVGKRTGSWYQVKYGSTTGWVYIKNFKR